MTEAGVGSDFHRTGCSVPHVEKTCFFRGADSSRPRCAVPAAAARLVSSRVHGGCGRRAPLCIRRGGFRGLKGVGELASSLGPLPGAVTANFYLISTASAPSHATPKCKESWNISEFTPLSPRVKSDPVGGKRIT